MNLIVIGDSINTVTITLILVILTPLLLSLPIACYHYCTDTVVIISLIFAIVKIVIICRSIIVKNWR